MADLPRNEESEKAFAEMKANCKHDGGFSNPVQTVVAMPGTIIALTANSCKLCGHFFTNINTIPLDNPSGIAIPKVQIGGLKS